MASRLILAEHWQSARVIRNRTVPSRILLASSAHKWCDHAMKIACVWALFLLLGCTSGPVRRAPLLANEQYGLLSPANKINAPDKNASVDVVLVPQWHLAANTQTTDSSAGLPQSENQRAIYRQLIEWVEGGQLQTVIVEGCEGEIQDGFPDRFNGWTLSDLQALSAEQLDSVMTHVGLKLKAKLSRKVRVLCGDRADLVKKHQLILSDMRGLLGFKTRIAQLKDEPKTRAEYAATARDLLKLPVTTDDAGVNAKINEQLKAKLNEFDDVLHQRDQVFVDVVKAAPPVAAVVIGAIHIDDLAQQLRSAKLVTQTWTPIGLKGDEAELLSQIHILLNGENAK